MLCYLEHDAFGLQNLETNLSIEHMSMRLTPSQNTVRSLSKFGFRPDGAKPDKRQYTRPTLRYSSNPHADPDHQLPLHYLALSEGVSGKEAGHLEQLSSWLSSTR